MPTQVPPGKLAARVREIVSAPPQKMAPAAASLRAAVRDHGAPAAVAPAVPFEFGAVPVQQPLEPVGGRAERGPPHAAVEPAPVEHGAPPAPAAAPKMEIKPKAAAPPPPKPEVPGARAARLPPPPVPRSPGATPALPAAAPLPAPRVALPAAAVRSPLRNRDRHTAEPPGRDLARVAPPSAAPWIRVFHGLRQVADALLARALASRSEVMPAPAARRAREGSSARDAHAAEQRGAAGTLAAAAGEVRRWAVDAGAAATAAAARPDAAVAAPFGPEASRIGQAARAVGAGLATVRAWRAAPGANSRARMMVPWTALESLLGRARDGDGGTGPAVSAAAGAASTEAEALAAGAGARPLAETGAPALFAAVQRVDQALDEAAHSLARVAPGKDDTAAIAVEAMLERAAAVTDTAGAEPPATVLPHPPGEMRNVDERRAPQPRVAPEKRARPERWELRIVATSTEVGVEDIARTLGIARIADLRDALAEGLSTRHQFVLWTRAGTTLTAALQALVNDGLIETRIQPRG